MTTDPTPKEKPGDAVKVDGADQPAPIPFSQFLESTPPTKSTSVECCWERIRSSPHDAQNRIDTPDLYLFCDEIFCDGFRYFRCVDCSPPNLPMNERVNTFLTYQCANCRIGEKVFSVQLEIIEDGALCYKFGEFPPFQPHTPGRLLRLFGDDIDLFVKGRRCESQGLGVGAFVYYRRLVENQKDRILDQIERVARQVNAPVGMIDTLNAAKKENQFKKAIEKVKDAIPQSLLIKGQNPLTLLHSALSGGLHAMSDETCLRLAHDARLVLAELTDRIGQALKDEDQLNAAVGRLMKSRQSQGQN